MQRFLIAAAMLFALSACNRETATAPTPAAELAQPSTPVQPNEGVAMTTATTQLTLPDPDGILPEGYVRTIGQLAYVWGWPMVNMINRRNTITKAPHPGLLGGVLPAAPRGQIGMLHDYIDPAETFVTCPNQDVVYGLGFFSLDEEPVVIQVPDFGDRFWVYALYDARTNQFGQVGKPYGSKPGFYLLAGPNWKGETPAGITEVVRSATELANAIPRVFQDDSDADRKAIQPVLNLIVAYPLSQFDGKMKTIDWANAPEIPAPASSGDGETKWVIPDKFFDDDQFGKALEIVPPLPGEEALYAQFRALLARQERPGHQAATAEGRAGDRGERDQTVLPVEAQRQAGRQQLESFGQQCADRFGLLQPHRYRQVEHVRQPAHRNAVLLHRHGRRG